MTILEWPVRLPRDVMIALGEYTGLSGNDFRLEPIIADAIRAYMKPAAPTVPTATQQQSAASSPGYQWKELFLPEGTMLRASFQRQSWYAVVEGEEIKAAAVSMSPSRFANLRGSGNRNAWKAVWLRLPGADQWLLADVCRQGRKAAITRLLGDATGAVGQPSGAAAPPSRTVSAPSRDRRTAPRRCDDGGAGVGHRSAIAYPAAHAAHATSATLKHPHVDGGRLASAPSAPPQQQGQVQDKPRRKGARRGAGRKRRAGKSGSRKS